jgi:D-alanyl-D-alanine carboxypeptidase
VTSFVDGDDLLAPVNRSPLGSLPPDYVPSDLVDRRGVKLRKDAADAFDELFAAMRAEHAWPRVESSYRSYGAQCGVFCDWATKKKESTFCGAVEQSALAGHSQHQLGTTVDLFTEEWFEEGDKKHLGSFRDGFGCTRTGAWLAENAWRFGFVLPYPIAPDDRTGPGGCAARWDIHVPANPKTGYRNEPWHIRFIGKENAARFHGDLVASGVGTPDEITVESWLRRRAQLPGDADLPVCDGCSCGACATLLPDGAAGVAADGGVVAKDPCGDAALWLEPSGLPFSPDEAPRIVDARAEAAKGGVEVVVKVSAPPHTVTQPPVVDAQGPRYDAGATYMALVPYGHGAHHYDDLPGAWRIAVGPDGGEGAPPAAVAWPWRASLARARLARAMNRANLYLPAQPGESTVKLVVPEGAARLRVTLLRDGEEHGTVTVDVR